MTPFSPSCLFQYYLMPYDMLTKDMLRDIFSGKKGMMKLAMVKFISVPKYDELSVKGLYDKLI